MDFPLDYARGCFPALTDGDTIYFDNAEGSRPLGAVKAFMDNGFDGDGDELLKGTRESLAYFLNSNVEWAADEIVLASDVSELTTRLSGALAKHFDANAEIVVTELDDERDLAPWLALERNGIRVERWPVRRQTATLDTNRLAELMSARTRLVVMVKASPAVGSIVELLPVALAVQDHPSSLLINWSGFLAHGAIDIRFLRADFVAASTRSFFGADVAFLWGKRERMTALRAETPELFDGIRAEPRAVAGLAAALRYVEELGLLTQDMQLQPSEDYGRRRHMRRGMQAIRHHERLLTALALRKLRTIPGVSVFGIGDPDAAANRIPHILFRHERSSPAEIASALSERNIRVGHGDGGAPHLMKSLGVSDDGCVSIAMLHYNREDEIERFADALHDVVTSS